MVRACDVFNLSADRVLRKLLTGFSPALARAFNAGRAHKLRHELMAQAREMNDPEAIEQLVTAARLCNHTVVRFLKGTRTHGIVVVPLKGKGADWNDTHEIVP